MATHLTAQSADVNNSTGISARLRHRLLIIVVLTVLIIGAVGYDLFGRWAGMQGGPEMAPGGCGTCYPHQVFAFVVLDFIG